MRGGCWDMTSTCVQGGIPRPLGGYQPIMEPHSPAPAWNMHNTVVPKQEPMDEDRNDSGLHSGSDFQSSSPGSDNSHDFNPPAYSAITTSMNNAVPPPYYTTTPVTSQYFPIQNVQKPMFGYHLGFNPLTPPNSDVLLSPQTTATKIDPKSNNNNNTINNNNESSDNNTTLTPHASPIPAPEPQTPSSTDSGESRKDETPSEDALKRLQMSLEKSGLLAALSPKLNQTVDEEMMKESWGEDSEDNLRMPTINSHGKVKTFKCKQCDFVAVTKIDFWEHSKAHIKADKQLQCPKCPFVTEYKHHLEYHLHKHFGSKPFKCDKCPYSCVNKSMLNSHMKSHSNVYQYRCLDCSYATKYCHSLKLHLRKYGHKPAMVLNPDGTPNPLPIIDVYGTRRGPKQKSHKSKDDFDKNESFLNMSNPLPATSSPMNNPFAHLMNLTSPNQMPLPFPYGLLPGALANPLFFQQLAQNQNRDFKEEEDGSERSVSPAPSSDASSMPLPLKVEIKEDEYVDGALDLSKPEQQQQPPKSRRKGKAFKLERSVILPEETESKEKESAEEEEEAEAEAETKEAMDGKAVCDRNYSCQFCGIAFGDVILYTMHMGYHGYRDPFTCNMCGEQCNDKIAFFLHIARNPHT